MPNANVFSTKAFQGIYDEMYKLLRQSRKLALCLDLYLIILMCCGRGKF